MKVYYSKYARYMIFKTKGGTKLDVNGDKVMTLPETIVFNNGIYKTEDIKEQEFLEKHPRFGKDFWDGKPKAKKKEIIPEKKTILNEIKKEKETKDEKPKET